MDIYEIITSLCAIVVSVVVMYGSSYIKRKIKESEYTDLINKVSTAVSYAEQMFGSGNGKKKYQFAIDYLQTLLDEDEFDEEVIKGVIESLVYNINQRKDINKLENISKKVVEMVNTLITDTDYINSTTSTYTDTKDKDSESATLYEFPINNNDNNDDGNNTGK